MLVFTWAAACLQTAAAEEDWYHLMTVHPYDGNMTWEYTSKFWNDGHFGSPDYGDFINDTIRDVPIEKIKITATNTAGGVRTDTYTLLNDYQGDTFRRLMTNSYRTTISSSHESSITGSNSFTYDPLGTSGGLILNYVGSSNGVRIRTTSNTFGLG